MNVAIEVAIVVDLSRDPGDRDRFDSGIAGFPIPPKKGDIDGFTESDGLV